MGSDEGRPSSMGRRRSGRFLVEAGLGLASTVFALLTLARKDWIKIVFTFAAARIEWRKAATASGAASA